MRDWLNPNDEHFELSRERLSVTTECPDSLAGCNHEQMRMKVYYKINRLWYVISKVRETYGDDFMEKD